MMLASRQRHAALSYVSYDRNIRQPEALQWTIKLLTHLQILDEPRQESSEMLGSSNISWNSLFQDVFR